MRFLTADMLIPSVWLACFKVCILFSFLGVSAGVTFSEGLRHFCDIWGYEIVKERVRGYAHNEIRTRGLSLTKGLGVPCCVWFLEGWVTFRQIKLLVLGGFICLLFVRIL